MDNPKQSPLTTISIGPGILGIERGIESTGTRLDVLTYVEIEAFIIANLVKAMELGIMDPRPIWSDAKTFPAHIFRGAVDLLIAGYPCPPFSNAGKRLGTEDPRHLWPYIERTIDVVRPRVCFFENVRGHVTLGLDQVISSLEGMGYRVRWGIFSAEETGAAHKRERVFIKAVRWDCLGNSELQSVNSSIRRIRTELDSASQLGNASEQRLQESRPSRERQLSKEGRKGIHDRPEQPSNQLGNSKLQSLNSRISNVGHTDNTRLEGRNIGEREERTRQRSTWANDSFAQQSVARPGQPQHGWEAPRTAGYIDRLPRSLRTMWSSSRKDFTKILGEKVWTETDFRIQAHFESTVGCSTDELRNREHFLRALGNSVYAPTAALAWETL